MLALMRVYAIIAGWSVIPDLLGSQTGLGPDEDGHLQPQQHAATTHRLQEVLQGPFSSSHVVVGLG